MAWKELKANQASKASAETQVYLWVHDKQHRTVIDDFHANFESHRALMVSRDKKGLEERREAKAMLGHQESVDVRVTEARKENKEFQVRLLFKLDRISMRRCFEKFIFQFSHIRTRRSMPTRLRWFAFARLWMETTKSNIQSKYLSQMQISVCSLHVDKNAWSHVVQQAVCTSRNL